MPRRVAIAIGLVALAGLTVYGVSRLGLHRISHALVSARPGWIAAALALMATSLVMRAVSWHEILRAALPETPIGWMAVVRATMIGVLGSAIFPGRLGEPARILVLARRLEGSTVRLVPVVAGTVFSQTLINLLALAILAVVAFTSVPLLHNHLGGVLAAAIVPALICLLVVFGPALLRRGRRARSARVRRVAEMAATLLDLGRQGLVVFARPRRGIAATLSQLCAWGLQWGACYMVVLSLGLQGKATPAAAAAVLLVVNVSAVLPATPSNVGVFQAACLVVLAAYGVAGGPALAYGIILQAVEVVTALGLGVPALLGEGMSWGDIRRAAHEGEQAEREEASRLS
jgi:phosphatidylinositol alpha-mannosyltransferase